MNTNATKPVDDITLAALKSVSAIYGREINTSAVAYHVLPDGVVLSQVSNFKLCEGEDCEGDVRAVRLKMAQAGEEVPPYSEGAMPDHAMIILFGPETDSTAAVECLRHVAAVIEELGLDSGEALTDTMG